MKTPLKIIPLLSVLAMSLTVSSLSKATQTLSDGSVSVKTTSCVKGRHCVIQDGLYKIQITGNLDLLPKGLVDYYAGSEVGFIMTQEYNVNPIKITANAPITFIYLCTTNEIKSLPDSDSISIAGEKTKNRCEWIPINKQKSISIVPVDGRWFSFGQIIFNDLAIDLKAELTESSVSMVRLFKNALNQANAFESSIKRTDRRHLTRLKKSLSEVLALMADEKENPKFPVTHMTVQENARLIMVLATVLNELLEEYGDIEAVKIQVDSLAKLSKQIRDAYGWQEGLAGTSSKSLVALSAVIDLELRDLVTTMSAFAADSAQVFYNLMKANHAVARAVLAKNGGDAVARSQVQAFAAEWNAPAWQNVLAKLMDAPQDYKGLVQPKLRLLLMAVESMSDKAEEVSLLIPTEGTKPVQQAVKIQKKK